MQSPSVRILIWLVIVLLLAGSIFLGFQYYLLAGKVTAITERDKANANVAAFNQLFVEKVLKTGGDVSYEDRLQLEQAAVNTDNQSIREAWKQFLASSNEEEAQQRVLVLLGLFASTIVY